MVVTQAQWKKRVAVFKFIYTHLVSEEKSSAKIKADAFENHLYDVDQMKMIEYFADHQQNMIQELKTHLAKNWTWDRINKVDQAIMIAAICEARTMNLDRKIIIDQALVTAKHFADIEAPKYINAILDKVIK